jgi:hypothetical protein
MNIALKDRMVERASGRTVEDGKLTDVRCRSPEIARNV